MREVMREIFGRGYVGKAFRAAVIALVLVYILVMTPLLTTMKAYADVSIADTATESSVDLGEDLISRDRDEKEVEEDYSSTDQISDDLEKDRYKNTWTNEQPLAEVLFEDKTLRTASEKHFRMSDGSYTLASYAGDVHYLSDGKYEEIDNTFEKKGSVYKNKANLLQVEVPESYTSGAKTKVSVGQYEISFELEGYSTAKEKKAAIVSKSEKQFISAKKEFSYDMKLQSTAKYAFSEAGVELEQILAGTQLKENIIVNRPLNAYSFTFDVQAKELSLTLMDSGDIFAYSKSGEKILTIPKGYMFDADGEYSNAVEYTLLKTVSGYKLTVTADKEWINSSERAFPVTIDPTVKIEEQSKFKSAATLSIPGLAAVVSGETALMSFDLSEKLINATIVSATMAIHAMAYTESAQLSVWANYTNFQAGEFPEAEPYEFPDPKNTSNMIMVYPNYYENPANTYLPDQEFVIIASETHKYPIDITRNIKQYIEFGDFDSFHGFAFTSNETNSVILICDENHVSVSLRPYVEINYRNNVGLEGYWDYDQYSVGRDTVYINKYNDAMTVVHEDVSISADLPINLQHVYMSAYKDNNFDIDTVYSGVNYGLGWKLNYQQVIRWRTGSNFEYYDADGTMHYFHHDSDLSAAEGHSVAEDEDGLGLKLHSMPNSQYKMVDADNNQSWFDASGRLIKLVDRNGNMTNIVVGNGAHAMHHGYPISEINDGKGRAITFSYNANGYLTVINYKRADGVTAASTVITYDSIGHITRITNDDGTYTAFAYDSKDNLIMLEDESKYAIKLVSDKTMAIDSEINTSTSGISIPTVKTRSVYESAGNSLPREWHHVSDNIYYGDYTLSVTALGGEEYVGFASIDEFSDMVEAYYAGISLAEQIALLILTAGVSSVLILIIAAVSSLEPYRELCLPYYDANFRVKNVYDNFGRLVSSYIDDTDSLTAVKTQYEEPLDENGEQNVNNNKVSSTVTFVPGVVNYVRNGSFENETASWSGTGSIGNTPFRSGLASGRYASQGNNSLEMFVSQPMNAAYTVYQNVTLPAGTYTLSANIRVDNLLVPHSSVTNYGAYIGFSGYINSEYVNADVYSANNGFRCVYVTYTFLQTITVGIYLNLEGCSGFVYFDEVQVVRNDYGVVDATNSAINEGFERWTGTLPVDWLEWNADITKITGTNSFAGNNTLQLNGKIGADTGIRQVVPISPSSQSRAFTVSAWINTLGRTYLPFTVSASAMGFRALDANNNAIYDYMDGLDGNGYYDTRIYSSLSVWQQISATFVVPAHTRYIEITFTLKYTTSKLLIDNVSIAESQILSFGYDKSGKNTSYSDGFSDYYYSENENVSIVGSRGSAAYEIVKDSSGNVLSNTDVKRSVKMQYTYDNVGRITSETVSSVSTQKKITSETSYQSIENDLINTVTDTDSLGFSTVSNYYAYSALLDKTVFNDGSYVEYEYSDGTTQTDFPSAVKIITVYNKTSSGSILSECEYQYLTMADALTHTDYGYRHVGMLRKVTMGNGTVYSYVYDKWGNVLKVRLNGVDQIIYEYREQDGALVRKTIGGANGYTEYYTYDKLGRLSEMRAAVSPSSSIWTLSDSSLKAHEYYEYSVSGNVRSIRETIDDKGYWYNYDRNGRLILRGEGSYTVNATKGIINTETVFETVYDVFGDVYRTSVITLDGETTNYGISFTSGYLGGTLNWATAPAKETVRLNSLDKIVFTNEYGHVRREDNTFLQKSFRYTRNQYGQITSVLVGAYTTASNFTGTTYTPFYSVKSTRYDYDNDGLVNGWDADWAIENYSGRAAFLPTKQDDVTLDDGTVISDILRMHQASYYDNVAGRSLSLISPNLLMNTEGQISLSYWMKKETHKIDETTGVAETILALAFYYSDGSWDFGFDSSTANNILPADLSWQYFSRLSTCGKSVARVVLAYSNNSWVQIGNVRIGVADNAWDNDWLINNQKGTGAHPAKKVSNEYINGIVVSDVVKLHQVNFYRHAPGAGFYSLVNPEILKNGGDCIELSYMMRRIEPDEENLRIAGLRFRYSDGTSSVAPYLDCHDSWQSYSIVSDAGKTVVAIEIGFNFSEYVHLGNVFLKTQSVGRVDSRISGETLFNGSYVDYTYDELGRLTDTTITANKTSATEYLKESYSYIDGSSKNLLPDGGDWLRRSDAYASHTFLDGLLTVTGITSTASAYVYKDIKLTAGTQYTFSFENVVANSAGRVRLYPYGTDTGSIVGTNTGLGHMGVKTIAFTSPTGYQGVRIYFYAYEGGLAPPGTISSIKNLQIEEGAYTSYEPYGVTSYTVSGLSVTRGATTYADYSYVYNMNASGAINTLASNPYNVYQIKEGSTVKAEYYYDGLGRLSRENSAYTNQTVTYAYDDNNNITEKTIFSLSWGSSALTGGTTKAYNYTNSTFKDRLTSYNGQAITYDALGNPLSYLGKSLTWQGRNLTDYNISGVPSAAAAFYYDASGKRIRKNNYYYGTTYLYDGDRLVREKTSIDEIWYLYDQDGMIGFQLNGSNYTYVRNLAGDVVKVIGTASGNIYATYTYDAWGKCTIGTNLNNIATRNPIRYRGYYYDSETGFYYLNSRYYDPETGRFVSPDVVAEGGNLYAYCGNDPINRSDPSGYWSAKWKSRLIKIAIGVVATVAAVAITVATGGAALPVIASVAASTVIGAGVSAGIAAIKGDDIVEAIVDGTVDGFMTGGLFALAGAAYNAAKSGIQGAKATGQVANASQPANTIVKTGQKHHVISNKVNAAINKNPVLRGQINRNDYIVQAVDKASHNGYQAWHRTYDNVLSAAAKNANTLKDFTTAVNSYYRLSEMIARFGKYIPFG